MALSDYEQNVTMTNPGPNGPVTQGVAQNQFATPEAAQRQALLTGGTAAGRTPAIGSYSTGTQQMLNYGGSDLNAGLSAQNSAMYGTAPGSYGEMLNSRDIARTQGNTAAIPTGWDNPNVDTNMNNLYQQRSNVAPIGWKSQGGQYVPVYPWDQGSDQRSSVEMLNPRTQMSPGNITAGQYAQQHPEDYTGSGQFQLPTPTMGKPLSATTTPGWQGPWGNAAGGNPPPPAQKDTVSRDPRANTPGYDQFGNPTGPGTGSITPGSNPAYTETLKAQPGPGGVAQDTSRWYDWNSTHDNNGNLIGAGGEQIQVGGGVEGRPRYGNTSPVTNEQTEGVMSVEPSYQAEMGRPSTLTRQPAPGSYGQQTQLDSAAKPQPKPPAMGGYGARSTVSPTYKPTIPMNQPGQNTANAQAQSQGTGTTGTVSGGQTAPKPTTPTTTTQKPMTVKTQNSTWGM